MMAAFTPSRIILTSDSSQRWSLLIVFLIQVVLFLVLIRMGDFQWYPGHFAYYVWKHQVLSKPFILADRHPV